MDFSKLKYLLVLIVIFFVCAAPSMNDYPELTEAPEEADYFLFYEINGSSFITKKISFLNMMKLLEESLTSFEIHADNVAGSAGPAESGDSATSFFPSGTIEHERGGLEADVSGYSGLLGISGGATSEVDTAQELEDMCGLGEAFSDLADDADAATQRTTLDVYSESEVDSLVAAREPTITDGSIDDGFVNRDTLDDLLKYDVVEEITTDADPDDIAPTDGWDAYKTFYFQITANADEDLIQLTETDLPTSIDGDYVYTRAIIKNAGSNTVQMTDISGRQEIPNDGTIYIEEGEVVEFIYLPGTGTTPDRWYLYNAEISTKSFANFNIRSGTNPTTDANNNIAVDSDDDFLEVRGSESRSIPTEFPVYISVAEPDLLDSRDFLPFFTNNTGADITIKSIYAMADDDDTDFRIEEYDADGSSNEALVKAETCDTGSGPYTNDGQTTITNATIEDGHILVLDFDDSDTPDYLHFTIWYTVGEVD